MANPSGSMGALRMMENQASKAGTLGIGDLSIGVSVSGAYDYLDGIKRDAIDGAIDALQSTDSVFQVFQGGWQGKAEANFEKNLVNATNTVKQELELIKTNIESLVAEMIEDWANQDDQLVEETDIVSF